MRKEFSPGTFDDVLDGIAKRGFAPDVWPGAYARNDDQSHMAEAAQIALSLANGFEPRRGHRPDLHRRFVDGSDESERGAGIPEPPTRIPPGLSIAELERLRRQYAKLNHPDRVAPCARDAANRRMAVFNQMIDQAIEQLESTSGRSR